MTQGDKLKVETPLQQGKTPRQGSSDSASLESAFSRLKRRFSRPREPRVVFLGSCEVGKTALIARMRADVFLHEYEPTVQEALPLLMRLRSRTVPENVDLVDVTGELGKEYASIRTRAVTDGDGFVVVFSVNSRPSFERVGVLLEEIAQIKSWRRAAVGARTVLVANQVGEEGWVPDADDNESLVEAEEDFRVNAPRVVTADEAQSLAEQYGVTEYVETSALTGRGVEEIALRLGTLFGAYLQKEEEATAQAQSFTQRVATFLGIQSSSSSSSATDDDAARDTRRTRHPSPSPSSSRRGSLVSSAAAAQKKSSSLPRDLKASGSNRRTLKLFRPKHNRPSDPDMKITSPVTSEKDLKSPTVPLSPNFLRSTSGRNTLPGRIKKNNPGRPKLVTRDDSIGRYYCTADVFSPMREAHV